jgi:hypothetical protein
VEREERREISAWSWWREWESTYFGAEVDGCSCGCGCVVGDMQDGVSLGNRAGKCDPRFPFATCLPASAPAPALLFFRDVTDGVGVVYHQRGVLQSTIRLGGCQRHGCIHNNPAKAEISAPAYRNYQCSITSVWLWRVTVSSVQVE